MKNILDYNKTIVSALIEADEVDENWSWYLVSADEHKYTFRWGYLDYIEEEKNFIIRFDEPEENDNAVICYLPTGSDVYVLCGKNFWDDCDTIEEGIKIAIKSAVKYAKQIY